MRLPSKIGGRVLLIVWTRQNTGQGAALTRADDSSSLAVPVAQGGRRANDGIGAAASDTRAGATRAAPAERAGVGAVSDGRADSAVVSRREDRGSGRAAAVRAGGGRAGARASGVRARPGSGRGAE